MAYFRSSVDRHLSCLHILLFWIVPYDIFWEGLSGLSREIETMYLNADRHMRRDWLGLEVYKHHCWHSASVNSRAAYLRHGVKASGPKNRWCDSQAGAEGPGTWAAMEGAQEPKGYRLLSWDTGKEQPSFWKERLWALLPFLSTEASLYYTEPRCRGQNLSFLSTNSCVDLELLQSTQSRARLPGFPFSERQLSQCPPKFWGN